MPTLSAPSPLYKNREYIASKQPSRRGFGNQAFDLLVPGG